MLFLAVATFLAGPAPATAARTDVVILRNGDHITGEIKSLSYGKLEYKTDDMSTIYVEWEKIHHITSVHRFEVVDTEGLRRWGSLERTDVPQEVIIMTSVGPDTLPLLDVVRLTRIKETFWRRLKGSVNIGFSYTRATKTAESELGGDTRYRSEKYSGRVFYDAYITDQAEARTSRYSFGFDLDRFLRKRWTLGGAVGLEHNEELGLDKRESLTATGSNYPYETNRTVVRASAGISGTRETYIHSDSTSYNMEIPLTLSYSRIQFHNPESSIELAAALFPSVTTEGRYRASVTAQIDHEIYADLYFMISFYYDYDSKPPEGAAKDDYRLSTGIKWTFG
ncbi:MAG: DUF481 domain-containing protein [bacterium]|jgi:hypothetical protein